jgi:hypothetical protein
MAKIEDHGLRHRLKPGRPVTLVLGAGVNRARGVPLWTELMREAWKLVFGDDPYALDDTLLKRARSACQGAGLPDEFVNRLDVSRHPFEVQFAFEGIFDALRWRVGEKATRKELGLRPRAKKLEARLVTNEQRASALFADLLRKILYRGRPRQTTVGTLPDTLSLIAQAVRKSATLEEHQRPIAQVITFNVDDLLEREVSAGSRRRMPLAIPIYGASAVRPLPNRKTIPIYHLHGFVPEKVSSYPYFSEDGYIPDVQAPAESLVFTDEQYWRSVGSFGGFASRTFAGALSERCVFIGLSMTDLNIIRWLALDAIERADDFRRLTSDWPDPTEAEFNLIEDLSRHYWITQEPPREHQGSAPPFGIQVLRDTLVHRGVDCIDIPSWESEEFHAWWRSCFRL